MSPSDLFPEVCRGPVLLATHAVRPPFPTCERGGASPVTAAGEGWVGVRSET